MFYLGLADLSAEISFAALTELALTALGGVEGNDMIARLNTGHPFTHRFDNPTPFMAENNRKNSLGIYSGNKPWVLASDSLRGTVSPFST